MSEIIEPEVGNPKNLETLEIEPYWGNPEILLFLRMRFFNFFLIIWFKSTKMKLRPYFTMELIQKLMKKTSKYLIYSPLTEIILTEWPCSL